MKLQFSLYYLFLFTILTLNLHGQSCLTFDGNDDRITINNTFLNQIGTGDFTFEAWISLDITATSINVPILSNRSTSLTGILFFVHGGNNLAVQIIGVPGSYSTYLFANNGSFNASLRDGNCHHVALSRANTLLSFYIDGNLIGTQTIVSNKTTVSSTDFTIGYDEYDNASFSGSISDVRIWNAARSSAQIQNYYTLTLNGSETNLIANWHLNDGSGQTITDSTNPPDNGILGTNNAVQSSDPIWANNCCTLDQSQSTFDLSFGVFGSDKADTGADITQLSDCNYLILGQSSTHEAILRKVDEYGNLIWEQTYNFTGATLSFKPWSMAEDVSDGSILIAGAYHTSNFNTIKLVIHKVDKHGACLWTKNYNNIGLNNGYYSAKIIQTKDKNFIITGTTNNGEAFLNKIYTNGNLFWPQIKIYAPFSSASDVVEMTNGNLAITGGYFNSMLGQQGHYLLETNSTGGKLNESYFFDNNGYAYANAIIETNDMELAITGFRGPGNNRRGFIIKTQANGTLIFGKEYVHPDTDFMGQDIVQNTDGTYAISGFCRFPIETSLININSIGNIIDSKNYPLANGENKTQLIKTSDGGYAIVTSRNGQSYNKRTQIQPSYSDIRFIKTDENGLLNGCETPISYSENNYTPSVFVINNSATTGNVTPQSLSTNCTAPLLNENLKCISGISVCDPPSIDLNDTYACKVDLRNDILSIDKGFDQILLPDNYTKVIVGSTFLNGDMHLFLEESDLNGNSIRKKSYPIQGTEVSNVQIIYDSILSEYVLFFDTKIGNEIDVYLLRVRFSDLMPINYHGPLLPNASGNFSWEYAVKIINDTSSTYSYNGGYVLLINQNNPPIRNSFVTFIDKATYTSNLIYQLDIGNSTEIKSYDMLEIEPLAACYGIKSYLICGSVDNSAFISKFECFGLEFNTIFDVDNNSSTRDPAKRIVKGGSNFFIAGETGLNFSGGVNGEIWLSEFSIDTDDYLKPEWLKIYENNVQRSETLDDLEFANGFLYSSGQTNIGISLPNAPIVGPKPYISKFDFNGNIQWAKEYVGSLNGYGTIEDLKVKNGAIYGVGNCGNLVYSNLGNIASENENLYINKTTLFGDLANSQCYDPISFISKIENPIITKIMAYPISSNTMVSSLLTLQNNLVCIKNCCSDLPCDTTELVIDGDFNDPTGTSFTSNIPQNCTCLAGSWCIDTDPKNKCANSAWQSFAEPNGCSSNFLIVDGSPGTIWSQNVSLLPNKTYEFSFWYYPNLSGSSNPNLNVSLDGNIIGNTVGIADKWSKYTYFYNSISPSVSAALTISQTTNTGFQDYAIDHISFHEFCDAQIDCPPYLYFDNTFIHTTDEHAGIHLNTKGTVPSFATTTLKAGQTITLNNGFNVQSGANFSLHIEACGTQGCCPVDPLAEPWLSAYVNNSNYSIEAAVDINGDCVFIVDDACNATGIQTKYFDCMGNLTCETYPSGNGTCTNSFLNGLSSFTILQGC